MRASVLVLATVAAFATGQINAQTAAPAQDYSEAYPLATEQKSFLVTWVDVVPGIRIDGTLTATVNRLKGFESGDVVISGPSGDKHVWYATLKNPTDKELTAAIKSARGAWEAERKVSLMAVPFSESRPPSFAPHDDDLSAAGPWPKALAFIEGMMRYKRAQHTQRLAETSFNGGPFVDTIEPVHRSQIEAKWHQSGGMLGIEGVRSDLYRNNVRPREWIGDIPVLNSFGHYQNVRGWKRLYPDGSKFLDVLSRSDSGEVFEVRQREKVEGRWKSTILFEEPKVRPLNYKRFAVDCASCHDLAGSGGYAAGLIPGSDGVLSDPFEALERAK